MFISPGSEVRSITTKSNERTYNVNPLLFAISLVVDQAAITKLIYLLVTSAAPVLQQL